MKVLGLCLIAIIASATFTPAKAPETVKVKVGKSKVTSAGKVTIKFVSVVEDSRCPINARCVWAGNARVKLAVSVGKAAARTIELNSGVEPRSIKADGYVFTFVELTPYPGDHPDDIKPADGGIPTLTVSIEKERYP